MLRGTLEIATALEAAGWAWREATPDQRISVDIFINDVRVGSAVAEIYRRDLEDAGIGDGRHCFRFQYPSALSAHQRHVISVCATNDRTDEIRRSPAVIEPSQAEATQTEATPVLTKAANADKPEPDAAVIDGCVDVVNARQIAGWVIEHSRPNTPLSLLITDNDVLLGRVLANKFRKDLEAAGKGSGYCAFEFDLIDGLSPFTRHEIRVRRENDGVDLKGSPIVIEPTRAIDPKTKTFLAELFAQAKTSEEISSTIEFLADQTAVLIRRLTELHGQSFERRAYQHFLSRWRRRLPDAEAAIASQSAPRQILRALVIDDYVPKLDRDAGSHAILSHIRSLQRHGFEVIFVPALEMRHESLDVSSLDSVGVMCCHSPFYASVEDVLAGQAGDFDLVYFHRVQNAAKYGELARTYCPKAKQVFSVADLHHLRLSRQARVEQRPELEVLSQRVKRAELLAAAAANLVITHSAVEADELAHFIPATKIHVIPWSIMSSPVTRPFAERGGVAFIGGYGHQPNLDAAHWLISEIMPRVRKLDPAIQCLLVGSDMPEGLRQLCVEGIEAVGYIDTLSEVFNRVRLTVAPLAFGAGVKGKVLESLAAGIPCVCTSVAAEGIALPGPLQAFVADDADVLAAAIHRLHSDAEVNEACGHAGLDLIADAFSQDKVDALMGKAIGLKPHL